MLIPVVPRGSRLPPLAGLAGLVALTGTMLACENAESFHKNADAGLLVGTGGATLGDGGATSGTGGSGSGAGGAPEGSGGTAAASGGGSGSGPGELGGTPGSGGTSASGGDVGTGGAVTASGGSAGAAAGAAGGAASAGGSGQGGRGTGGSAAAGAGGDAGEGGAASMACPTCTLMLTYLPVGTSDGQSIAVEVHVGTTSVVPINKISVKYWYTNETGTPDITTDVDYVGLSTGSGLTKPAATGTPTTTVTPARTNANTVTSITLPDTVMLTPGTQLFIRFRLHASDYRGKFTMANDYSFGATQNLSLPWPRITAYVGGVKAWGNEPQ